MLLRESPVRLLLGGGPPTIPTDRVHSAGVSTLRTPHRGHAISTSTSSASPARRLSPALLPLPDLRGHSPAHGRQGTRYGTYAHMRTPSDRMCRRSRAASGLWRYIRSADEAGDHGGNRARMGMGMGAPSLPSVVAPQPGFASAPSAVGADPLLPLRPATATATAVCVRCDRFLPPACVWGR